MRYFMVWAITCELFVYIVIIIQVLFSVMIQFGL